MSTVNPCAGRLHVEPQFDPATCTVSYIVLDRSTGRCALIDPVMDYHPASGRVSHEAANRLIARVGQLGASLAWILETHVHADHLSAAAYIKQALGGCVGIGAHIIAVQETFVSLFNAGSAFPTDGSQFDRLFEDGDSFAIGRLRVTTMHTPGHTPACVSYVVSDGGSDAMPAKQAAFVGDTLFMPDFGTARCDFPGGDARQLYRSIHRLLSLPPETMLYTCHDYQPGGRELRFATTVAEQLSDNIHLRHGINEDEFVAMREARDASLPLPALLIPSVQVNMRGGHFPPPEGNGVSYLKLPLNSL